MQELSSVVWNDDENRTDERRVAVVRGSDNTRPTLSRSMKLRSVADLDTYSKGQTIIRLTYTLSVTHIHMYCASCGQRFHKKKYFSMSRGSLLPATPGSAIDHIHVIFPCTATYNNKNYYHCSGVYCLSFGLV